MSDPEAMRAELIHWAARLALRAAGHDAPGLDRDLCEAAHVMLKAERVLRELASVEPAMPSRN